MARSARLFLCARCRDQVLLCSHCDRGQLYCSRACSFARRHERRRESAQRYQSSQAGRLKHAARSACWRERRRAQRRLGTGAELDKVTHQGCPRALADASLQACDTPPSACQAIALAETAPQTAPATPGTILLAPAVCRRCAHSLLPHVRLGGLRRSGASRHGRHDHPC